MVVGNEFVLFFSALSAFLSIGVTAIFARWAISRSKHDTQARYGAFCIAIGLGLGAGRAYASIGSGSVSDAKELGEFLGFIAILVVLWLRWFRGRAERN